MNENKKDQKMNIGNKFLTIKNKYIFLIKAVVELTNEISILKEKQFTITEDEISSEEIQRIRNDYQELLDWLNEKPYRGIPIEIFKEISKIQKLHNSINKIQSQNELTLNMAQQYLIALFEAFNKDFLFEIYISSPKSMSSKDKKISYEEIFKHSSLNELIEMIASEETNEIGWLDIDKFSILIEKRFNINIVHDFSNWNQLRENYYRRNINVHNKGIISKIYATKLELDKNEIGNKLDMDISYIENCSNNIIKYIEYIFEKFKEKFNWSFYFEDLAGFIKTEDIK